MTLDRGYGHLGNFAIRDFLNDFYMVHKLAKTCSEYDSGLGQHLYALAYISSGFSDFFQHTVQIIRGKPGQTVLRIPPG